jgi:hypothetical protein
MPSTSPTARTLAELRRLGYLAEKVEQRLPRVYVTRDLFGIIDVLAVRPGEVLGVQCTSGSNAAARVKKALATSALRVLLAAGVLFEVWGWRKSVRSRRWELTRRPLTLADLDPAGAEALDAGTAARTP